MAEILGRTVVGELVANKAMLMYILETSTVEQLLKMMLDYNMTAVPVAHTARNSAGAGGPIQYIGLVSMLDIVLYLAENLNNPEALGIPVASIIGQTTESHTLRTASPSTKLQDGLEYLCKGAHRFLVSSQGNEMIYSNGNGNMTSFRLLSQMDVISFFIQHLDELGPSVTRTVEELGLLNPNFLALAVPSNMRLVNALRLMRRAGGSTSLAVVEPTEDGDYSGANQRWVRGGKIVGTLSVSNFLTLDTKAHGNLVSMTVGEFLSNVCGSLQGHAVVTCSRSTRLAKVMDLAVGNKADIVWVTDEDGWLIGEVRNSDMINAVKRNLRSFRRSESSLN